MTNNTPLSSDELLTFIRKVWSYMRSITGDGNRQTLIAAKELIPELEIIEVPKGELKKLSFKFPMKDTSNREVLEFSNLSKSFGDKVLFKNISAQLEWTKEKPHRVFILGSNGCGKTTLFKILTGRESYDEGSIKFGSRVQLGYYAQHQLQILDPNKTLIKTLEDPLLIQSC